jgi:hypothetical protein
MKAVLVLGISCLALAFAVDPTDLGNGPIGSNQGGYAKGSVSGSHNNKGKFDGNRSGASVNGQTNTGTKLAASKSQGGATANNGGGSANAKKQGTGDFNADSKGKAASAKTSSKTKLESGKAGGKDYKGSADNGVAVAGPNNNPNVQHKAKQDVKAGISTVKKNGGREYKTTGTKDTNKKVKKQKTTAYNRFGQKVVYESGVNKKGNGIIKGPGSNYETVKKKSGKISESQVKNIKNKKTIYKSKANGQNNKAGLYSPTSRKGLAELKLEKVTGEQCSHYKPAIENEWDKETWKVYYDDIKVHVEPKVENGQNVYDWPSCMDITLPMDLPPGIEIKDVAINAIIHIPNCGQYTCGAQTQCLGVECFYPDLCNPDSARGSNHKDAANYLLDGSFSNYNVCSTGVSRSNPIILRYCPDVNAKISKKDTCIKNALFGSRSGLEMYFFFHTVANRPLQCENTPTNRKQLTVRGCQHVVADYSVTYLGVPRYTEKVNKLAAKTQDLNDKLGGQGKYLGAQPKFGGVFGRR